MLPLVDLHAQLDEALNTYSVSTVFSPLYYTDLINEERARWIRNEYNKNRSIDPNIQQSLSCVDLELVDPTNCCVTIPGNCKILRTVKPIPNTIEFYFTKGLTSIGPVDITKPRFTLIDYSRVPYIGHGRTTAHQVYAFLYDQYIYVVSRDTRIITMKNITIRGIFENPVEVGEFSDCNNKPCWTPNDIYPINQWMWVTIKEYIIQKLLQKQPIPIDYDNNGKDDRTELNGGARQQSE